MTFRQTRRHKRPQRACLTARTFRLRLLPPSSLRLPVHCVTVARRIRTRGHLAHGHWHADIARAFAAGWNVRVPSRFSAAARPVRFVAARGLAGLAADAQHCSWQPECNSESLRQPQTSTVEAPGLSQGACHWLAPHRQLAPCRMRLCRPLFWNLNLKRPLPSRFLKARWLVLPRVAAVVTCHCQPVAVPIWPGAGLGGS
jgi:hypothetical protein